MTKGSKTMRKIVTICGSLRYIHKIQEIADRAKENDIILANCPILYIIHPFIQTITL